MGVHGPVPKRTDQRHGHRKAEPADKAPPEPRSAPSRGSFKVPLPADGSWHPTAKKWYQALRSSGQSGWYEASDWMEAYVAATVLSEMLDAGRVSAMLYASWASHTARLLVTEGDRRRMRIELEKPQAPDPAQKADVANLAAWRDKLGSS